jgi:hypothetical protein
MVSVGDLIIVMAGPAGFPWAVRYSTFNGKRVPIPSFKDDLLVERILRYDNHWIKKREEESD